MINTRKEKNRDERKRKKARAAFNTKEKVYAFLCERESAREKEK